MRPLIVVSDVHLAHGGRDAIAADLARLVALHPGHEMVLNGDIFNLSSDPPGRAPAESAATMVKVQDSLATALSKHVAAGHPLTFLAGNHDAGIQIPETRAAFCRALDVTDDAPLRIVPWFIRRNGVHVEHGHFYDPDNAPTHPLAPPTFQTEPLGVSIVRRFLGPYDAFVLAHQHEMTPVEAVKVAIAMCGARAPLFLVRFCVAGAKICAHAVTRSHREAERAHGQREIPRLVDESGVGVPAVQRLLSSGPAPTHTSFRRAFMRLYFDRALAALALPPGLAAFMVGGYSGALWLMTGAVAYLAASLSLGANRYPNRMSDHLRMGADLVRHTTGADLVIFGHTHREDTAAGYENSGSFGYPAHEHRSYLAVDEHGHCTRRFLSRD